MSHLEHESAAASRPAPRVAILTLSDSRTAATDTSGDAIAEALSSGFGCTIVRRTLLPDDGDALLDQLHAWLDDHTVDAILTTGGTGLSPRDRTADVVERLIERPLPGFGELFRMLSWHQVGAAAMLSRATAGIARGQRSGIPKPIFALPGSTAAVTPAVRDLIGPQLRHVLAQLHKPERP